MNPVEGISLVKHEVLAHSDRIVTASTECRREIDGPNSRRKLPQDGFLRFAPEQLACPSDSVLLIVRGGIGGYLHFIRKQRDAKIDLTPFQTHP